ncbi:transglycosylase SLT domain-containing protein [Myxococcaceae bacterium GXIMD 01537]
MKWTGVVAGLMAGTALAQSPATLEAVRLHKPDAPALAGEELRACEARKCPEAPRLALLAGTLALSDGQAAEAVKLLSTHPAPPLLEAFHAFYLGQARFYAGDAAGAAADFARALDKAPPSLAVRARARLGEAWLKAGEPRKAAPSLEAAASAQPTAELLFQRAQARHATGNAAGARADLKSVALRFPSHPYGDEALRLLEAQEPPVRLTFTEVLQRARGLADGGAPARALSELEKAEALKPTRTRPEQAQVALLRAQALMAQGKAAEAEKSLALARQGPTAVAAQARLIEARRALRSDDHDRARALMAALDKAYPGEPAGEEGGYFLGWLNLQDERYEEAVKAFTAYDARYPRSRRRDDALWFRALALIRLEKYDDSRKTLEQLINGFPRSNLVPQARYWLARGEELAGKGVDVTGPAYEAVLSSAPASFYALLASARLRELGRVPAPPFPQPPAVMEAQRPPDLELAVALTQAGLFRDAAEEVESRASRIRTSEQALAFTHALLKLGEFGHAHSVAARHLWGRAFGARSPDALAAFYPRAWASAVETEASRQALDPYLVWAIMRRESAFKPEVMSAADARGLMQIIPPTANAIAQRLEEPAPAPAELFSPDRSIRYGAWYLAALTKRFTHPVLVAAAYNAGPSAAVRWLREKGKLPLDLFVEIIPFKETRGYVKQVVADLFLYHSFYGGKAPRPELQMTLPAPTAEGVNF